MMEPVNDRCYCGECEDCRAHQAIHERMVILGTKGAAFQALDGYPEGDLRDPVIADAEANPQIGLPLGDAPRRGKTNAVREGR